jgi:hypothetical protein
MWSAVDDQHRLADAVARRDKETGDVLCHDLPQIIWIRVPEPQNRNLSHFWIGF